MDIGRQMALSNNLQGMNLDTLRKTAELALVKCDSLECQQGVMDSAFAGMRSLLPTSVEAGTQVTLGTVGGMMTGLARGLGGPLWGRVVNLVPAGGALALGLFGGSANARAVGWSTFTGITAATAGLEARDAGEYMRAKIAAGWNAKVTKGQTTTAATKGTASPPPPPP